MTEQQLYDRAVNILDNFFSETQKIIPKLSPKDNWREQMIYKGFKQSSHIAFVLLSNTEKSKYQNVLYVNELILVGTLGRIIRDIYVNIIYLKTDEYSDEEMKLCWDFQVIFQKWNLTKFEDTREFETARQQLEMQKDELLEKLKLIKCSTKGQLQQGKVEKLLSLQELATINGFNKDRFENEFQYFSQFAHSTAFGNNYIKENGIPLAMLAVTYDKIASYFVGVLIETVETLYPEHEHLNYLQDRYKEIIESRWGIKDYGTKAN